MADELQFKQVTAENLDKEHICCAITEKKGECCVSSKKEWMKKQLEAGLVFLKLDVRGKVFIEYLPAEAAWYPVEAEDCMFIDCLWVSGQYKGKGYGAQLLEKCIEDSRKKGKKGLAAVSSKKKRPFLSDPGFWKRSGFQIVDEADPDFTLWFLPLVDDVPVPKFRACAKTGEIGDQGFVLYYTNQCPHTGKYAPLLKEWMAAEGHSLAVRKFTSCEEAQKAPCPFTTYALFWQGKLLTNEILSEKSLKKLLQKIQEQ